MKFDANLLQEIVNLTSVDFGETVTIDKNYYAYSVFGNRLGALWQNSSDDWYYDVIDMPTGVIIETIAAPLLISYALILPIIGNYSSGNLLLAGDQTPRYSIIFNGSVFVFNQLPADFPSVDTIINRIWRNNVLLSQTAGITQIEPDLAFFSFSVPAVLTENFAEINYIGKNWYYSSNGYLWNRITNQLVSTNGESSFTGQLSGGRDLFLSLYGEIISFNTTSGEFNTLPIKGNHSTPGSIGYSALNLTVNYASEAFIQLVTKDAVYTGPSLSGLASIVYPGNYTLQTPQFFVSMNFTQSLSITPYTIHCPYFMYNPGSIFRQYAYNYSRGVPINYGGKLTLPTNRNKIIRI